MMLQKAPDLVDKDALCSAGGRGERVYCSLDLGKLENTLFISFGVPTVEYSPEPGDFFTTLHPAGGDVLACPKTPPTKTVATVRRENASFILPTVTPLTYRVPASSWLPCLLYTSSSVPRREVSDGGITLRA